MHNLRAITGIDSNKVCLRVSLTMRCTTEIQIKKKIIFLYLLYLMQNEKVPVSNI